MCTQLPTNHYIIKSNLNLSSVAGRTSPGCPTNYQPNPKSPIPNPNSQMNKTIDRYRKRKKRLRNNTPKNDIVSSPKSILFHHFNFDESDLPEEVIFSEILTRLPVNSLIKFKLVSKSWNSLISTPNFIKSHLKQTILNQFVPFNCVFIVSPYFFYILNFGAYDRYPDDQRGEKGLIHVKNLNYNDNGVNTFLIGSCNGLICFGRGGSSNGFHYYFRVYNPVMGHYCHVLDPLGNFQWVLMCGFGYVSSKDDYFLFVAGLQKRSSEIFVYVFSIKAKIWRKIGVFNENELTIFSGGRGVLVNETLHWDRTQVWTPNQKCICGFDLVDETFKDVKMPGAFSSRGGGNLSFKLCEINGCLGAWIVNMNGLLEMWVLKEYGVWDSWMILFKMDMVPGFLNFRGWTENGKVLVQTDDGSLLLADPKSSPTEYVSLVKDLGDMDALSFVRSPVSPLF
ncbi:F-box/kelch-repeat protein At3g23880-like [Silene latifolia]|uniref:F-box/kelch-repeat protein At3g23880-like n=1 Tax=Silene latifolia TaxID=37657 RepID=UPI003D771A12